MQRKSRGGVKWLSPPYAFVNNYSFFLQNIVNWKEEAARYEEKAEVDHDPIDWEELTEPKEMSKVTFDIKEPKQMYKNVEKKK